jgi:hypothetical protein
MHLYLDQFTAFLSPDATGLSVHSPSNSSARASTAAWIGAHRSSTASRSGEPGAVALPSSDRAWSWAFSSARLAVRVSINAHRSRLTY